MKIIYSRKAAKAISLLELSMKQRIKLGVEGLTETPPVGDIKMIQGLNHPCYRLRIGKFRIIYEYKLIDGQQALVISDIGSRGDIYK